MPTWSETLPAGIRPGQRTMAGTRMPPSNTVHFRPKNGALLDSHSPPLSFVKMTIGVFGNAGALDDSEKLADLLVEMLHHGDVVRTRARFEVLRHDVPRIVRRDGRIARHLVGPMRRRVGDVEEEGLVLVLVDEPGGALRDEIRRVARYSRSDRRSPKDPAGRRRRDACSNRDSRSSSRKNSRSRVRSGSSPRRSRGATYRSARLRSRGS